MIRIGLAALALTACSAELAVEPIATPTSPPTAVSSETAPSAEPHVSPHQKEAVSPARDTLTIVAVGDIMPGSVTPIPFFPDATDHNIPTEIRRTIPAADLVFGNLEGTFVVDGIAPIKCRPETREARRCFEFGFPPFLASFLREAGFTVLSLDNNHAEDYGLPGYVLTQGLLAQAGITAVPKRAPVFLPIGQITVAVVPFGFSPRSFHISDLETARAVVAEVARAADIVVVSFHGGAEGAQADRVVDATEEYFGEDRGNALRFAHAVVDAGADLVLGHGPHVPRAMEAYQGRLIAYSLGNFWTYGNISIKGPNGLMPLLEVTLSRDGRLLSGRLVSMRQRLPGIPEGDPEGNAVRMIATRSAEDFPDNSLTISDAGELMVQTVEEALGAKPLEPCVTETSSECSGGDSSARD